MVIPEVARGKLQRRRKPGTNDVQESPVLQGEES